VHGGSYLLDGTTFKPNTLPSKALSGVEKVAKVILNQKVQLDGLTTGKLSERKSFKVGNQEIQGMISRLCSTFIRMNNSWISSTADFVFFAAGMRPNSDLIRNVAPEFIAGTGHIKVQPDLTIDRKLFPGVYAVGDVAGKFSFYYMKMPLINLPRTKTVVWSCCYLR
jgi:hypothetical protein